MMSYNIQNYFQNQKIHLKKRVPYNIRKENEVLFNVYYKIRYDS